MVLLTGGHMELIVRAREGAAPGAQPVEVVERKGRGHPDTICDAIAETISIELSGYYRSRFAATAGKSHQDRRVTSPK